MKKLRRSRAKKSGLPPGTLMHVGEVKTQHSELTLFRYDSETLSEKSTTNTSELDLQLVDNTTLWLNIHGLHQPEVIAEIGRAFNLHPLMLEDILNTNQRPKLDVYENCLFVVTRFFDYNSGRMQIDSEQVSLVLGKGFVLSFQERKSGSFDPVRERLRNNRGNLRNAGAGHLVYALLDMVVDRYFVVLEQMDDDCEALEDKLLKKPNASLMQIIHTFKRESLELRRAVWPLREVVNSLVRNESGFFDHETILHLRDVYDHTVHFIESLEALRDLLAGMLDIYLSSISNRVNMEVRALTVVAMLFMPATLIAGIFGMNFEVMPWLKNPDGFWFALVIMASIFTVMGLIFWRRQWLNRR
jgi:magnesium transporter